MSDIKVFLGIAALFTTLGRTDAALIRYEDFSGPALVGYSVGSGTFSGNIDDYLLRVASTSETNFDTPVSGFSGHFIALEDIDGAGFATPNSIVLDLIPGAFQNISLSYRIAAPNSTNTRYEVTDYLRMEYSVDGGVWQVATATEFRGDSVSTGLWDSSHTTNIGAAATLVGADLTGVSTTTSLQVRVAFNSEGSQEEMAFDDISIYADAVPEPQSALMLLFGAALGLRRRRC